VDQPLYFIDIEVYFSRSTSGFDEWTFSKFWHTEAIEILLQDANVAVTENIPWAVHKLTV